MGGCEDVGLGVEFGFLVVLLLSSRRAAFFCTCDVCA